MKKDKLAGVLFSAALHFDGAWNGMKPQRRSIRFSQKKRKPRNLGGRKDVFQFQHTMNGLATQSD